MGQNDHYSLLKALRSLYDLQRCNRKSHEIIDSVIDYLSCLALNPADLMARQVDTSNEALKKVISEPAGLALLCSGPAQIHAEIAGASPTVILSSGIRLFHEGGNVGKGQVIEAIQNFIQFLLCAKEKL